MKRITEGEMPDDFWNYKVNPIVGYYVPKLDEHSLAVEKKYNKTTQSI